MSRSEKQTTGPQTQDDNYEAAVLDFLNKEIAAAQPVRNQNDQSAELDALVSDLLKQVITESDQQQKDQTAVPEDLDSLISNMMPAQEEALPPESNLLANLDRELSQTVGETDFWDSEGINSKTSPDADNTECINPFPAKAPVLFPTTSDETLQDSAFVTPVEEKVETWLPLPYDDSVFRPILTPKRKLPVKAIAIISLLIVVGGAIYHFSGSSSSASKSPSTLPDASAPVTSASTIQVVPPSVQPVNKAAKTQKAVPPPSSKTVAANTPNATAAAQRPSTSTKETQRSAVQQPLGNSQGYTDPEAFQVTVNAGAAKPANEEVATLDRPALTPINAPATTSLGALAAATERAPQSAIHSNGDLENSAAAKSPARPVAPALAKIEDSTAGSQNLSAAPSQGRILNPAAPISQASPSYPDIALRSRTSGKVVLELQIDEKGRVTKATPVSGPPIFHYAAVNAAMKWRYKPASVNGTNVPSQANVLINFNLKK